MQITEIRITKGITLNTGDYTSVRMDCTLHAEIKPGEDAQNAAGKLGEVVWAHLLDEARPHLAQMSGYKARGILTQQFGLTPASAADMVGEWDANKRVTESPPVPSDDEDGFDEDDSDEDDESDGDEGFAVVAEGAPNQ